MVTFIAFVSIMASFPCSNAPVERIFSSLKLIKTEKRSPVKSETLVALMQTRFALKLCSHSAENNLGDKILSPPCQHESRCNQLLVS